MSLVKPTGIQGLNTGHALNANIKQFLDFGQSNTDLVSSTAFTTGATNADIAALGQCVLATNANKGASVDLSVVGGDTILAVYQHAGTNAASEDSRIHLFDYDANGNILSLECRQFSTRDYLIGLRANFSSTAQVELNPFQNQGFVFSDPHATALTVGTDATADLTMAYMDGTELTSTGEVSINSAFNPSPLPVPILPTVGTNANTYLSALVVFNKILSAAELASVTTDPWAMVSTGPSITVTPADLPLIPGGTISGTYADYATIPTTLTVSDGTNTITVPATIDDTAKTFTGTMPALPTTGTANLVLFGDVTVELS